MGVERLAHSFRGKGKGNNKNMVSLRQRLNYGIGGAVYSIKEAAYVVFVLLFYTQVLGLSGTVMFLTVLWDAFSDPRVGDFLLVLRNQNFRNVLIYDIGASSS